MRLASLTGVRKLNGNLTSRTLTVLGIETSCDDTAAAVVRRGPDGRARVLSNIVRTQYDEHAEYGGVVPEIAARSHVERLDRAIEDALAQAKTGFSEIDAISATAGPGLVGGVLVGLTTAKAIAIARATPLIPLNHLEAHALSARMTGEAEFPFLLLLISGGHTQLIWVEALGRYRRLGTTIDDAAGEAFDKTAKLLGLGQPGGPIIEAAAVNGRADRHDFPTPLERRPGCDFSFSGLKTAVREAAAALAAPTQRDIADLAAAFQQAAARHLVQRTENAIDEISAPGANRLVAAGGVAANGVVKTGLRSLCARKGWTMLAPPPEYCTDNGAMVAWAGAERAAAGLIPDREEALAMAPRARWPLAPPLPGREIGGGRKGPRA